MTVDDEARAHRPARPEKGTMPIIEVRRLTKRYGRLDAVEDLSFTVEPGRVTGFLGPNGSGKSTTLRAILGLVRPTAGSTFVLEQPFRALAHPAAVVGASLEAKAFHPGRTARQHLRILATAAGLHRHRVDAVLEQVGLHGAAGRRAGGFSLGMGQRLSLAAALLGEPRVLVLDEPANGLDPAGMLWLRTLLRGFAADGGTVLLSSHALGEVAQTVDDVVIINHGKLVTAGPLAHLDAMAEIRLRVRSPHAERLRQLLRTQGRVADLDGPDQLLVTAMSPAALGELANAQQVVIHAMTTETSSLEERFLALTADGHRHTPRADHSLHSPEGALS
jgi:ABC-2 type transport system ATP-binding protein